MIELDIDTNKNIIKVGITHNSYKYASVIDKIEYKQLCAVYHIENTGHNYYKKIVLDEIFNNCKNIITQDSIDTREINFPRRYNYTEDLNNLINRCSYCEGNTNHYIHNIPICSKYCENEIIKLCKDTNNKLFQKVSNDKIFKVINNEFIKYVKYGYLEKAFDEIH